MTTHPFVDEALITRGTFPSLERANAFLFFLAYGTDQRVQQPMNRDLRTDPSSAKHPEPPERIERVPAVRSAHTLEAGRRMSGHRNVRSLVACRKVGRYRRTAPEALASRSPALWSNTPRNTKT